MFLDPMRDQTIPFSGLIFGSLGRRKVVWFGLTTMWSLQPKADLIWKSMADGRGQRLSVHFVWISKSATPARFHIPFLHPNHRLRPLGI